MASRIVELAGHCAVKITDEIGCTITRGATGRFVSFLTPEEKRIDALAAAWFALSNEREFRAHDAAHQFAEAAGNAPLATGRINFYRGRLFTTDSVTDPFEFGPPPKAIAGHGRYNPAGKSALYLASTVAGVAAELERHRHDGMYLFCQSLSVDLQSLKVADLAADSMPIFQICFDYSELERDAEKYFKSQVLAELISRAGFHGFLVPGVRGSKENRYQNLVLFDPELQWREWIDASNPPQLVEA